MRVGQLARRIAVAEGWSRQASGDAFFAGMLYEVGLPVLVGAQAGAWVDIRAQRCDDLECEHAVERDCFGCSVTQASAYLLGLWGFNEPVVEAIATQPADPAEVGTVPGALLLSFARRAVCFPDSPQRSSEAGYLTAERRDRWEQIARTLPELEPTS
jgi:HD-like signal output (HDOD) protein